MKVAINSAAVAMSMLALACMALLVWQVIWALKTRGKGE